jgi:hypothetical protein
MYEKKDTLLKNEFPTNIIKWTSLDVSRICAENNEVCSSVLIFEYISK